MRRSWFLLFACAAALILCGCRTSEVTCYGPYEGQPLCNGRAVLANVQAVNYGFYLFGFIPLWGGDPHMPNSRHYVTLHDRVKEDYNEMMMVSFVRRRYGAGKLADCHHSVHFSGLYTLFIVWRKVINSRALWVTVDPVER